MSTATDIEQDSAPEVVVEAPVLTTRRWLRRSLIGTTVALIVLGAAAAAAAAYDRAHQDELLPGVRVGGIAAGGRESAEVLRQLEARVPAVGRDTSLRIVAGPSSTALTLADMGLHSDAATVLDRVRADADDMGLVRRVWHRLLGKPVRESYAVRLQVERDAVRDAMIGLGTRIQREPQNARIDTATGLVNIVPAVDGRTIDLTEATNAVFARGEELAREPGSAAASTVEAPLLITKAKVTGFADVILIRTGENRLYHYENGALVKTYTVATGLPAYPTPTGTFRIELKRRMPTWVNPDPTGWGKSLPKSIPPGPRNPLGTRALNLNTPGIRIHGTTNVASLGTAASHGCIRMSMPEVEELFDKVDTGTPVIIIRGPVTSRVSTGPASSLGDPNSPVDLDAG